jgi:hypothetical protein
MKMDVIPHEAVGPLRFGMPRQLVARSLDAIPTQRKSILPQGAARDFFFENTLRVDYDDDNLCAEIEFVERGRWSLSYKGYELFARPALDVLKWAQALDSGLEIDSTGFLSTALGIGMYADGILSPEGMREFAQRPAETIVIFKPGFRDMDEELLDQLLREKRPRK